MSEKQLHEPNVRPRLVRRYAVRPCEMEACSESQHRTSVNLRAGCLTWASELVRATPHIRSGSSSSEGGSGETFLSLTPRDLQRSHSSPRPWASVGRVREGNDNDPMSLEKSDHPIVVTKPGNAGGAKGMTN